MYELIKAGENTYYLDCPSRSGIYVINQKDICIIDGGSDNGSAKKLCNHINNMGWNPVMILNTHCHADHDGGNAYLQQRFNCPVYASEPDASLIANTLIQPTTLYGAYPNKDLLTKFFYASPSKVSPLSEAVLPEGLSFEVFPGHSPAQTIFKTKDDIWFTGDVTTPKTTIEKYHISYLYNVEDQLNSLNRFKTLEGKFFIPSHGPLFEDTKEIVEINLNHINSIIEFIKEECKTPKSIDELLKAFFDKNQMQLNMGQHLLCGATLRSYVSYLYNEKQIEAQFNDNILKYKLKEI